MDDLIPQTPDDEPNRDKPAKGDTPPKSENSRRRKAGQIFDEDDCLRGLTQLPGLIGMKIIRASDANAMRGIYAVILQHYQRAQTTRATSSVSDADVMAMLKAHPELLNMLEPLLTDEQLRMVLGSCPDDEPNDEEV